METKNVKLQEDLSIALKEIEFHKDQIADLLNSKQSYSDEVALSLETLKI